MKILLDGKDRWLLTKFNWFIDVEGYPRTTIKIGKSQWKMHWFILKEKGKIVDHKNGNKLDNRRSNLRFCEHWQNMANSKRYKNNTSGFKGAAKHRNKWAANIRINKNQTYLGIFKTKYEAHIMYCMAADCFFGEFANPGYREAGFMDDEDE